MYPVCVCADAKLCELAHRTRYHTYVFDEREPIKCVWPARFVLSF